MILIQPPTVQNWNSLVNKPSILSDNQISWDEIQNKPTTLAGYGITNGQPLGNELTALQNLSDSAGFLKKLGDGNYSIDNNNYLPLSGGTVTNELSVQHISQSGDTWTSTFSAARIELGQSTSASAFSLIDFHSGGSSADFSARILCTGDDGNGENRGGSLAFFASNLSFITGDVYDSKTMTIDGNGSVTIDGTYLGNGSGLTSLNASNISTGTLNAARLPTSYLPLAGGTVAGVTNFSNATPSTSTTTGASVIAGGQGVGGNQHIGGFTSLGGTAGGHPAIKIKVLEGITAATQGDYVSIPHGISIGKIVSITAYVDKDSNGALLVFPNYSYTPGYYYELIADNTYVTIVNHPTNSYVILSKKFIATIFYKE